MRECSLRDDFPEILVRKIHYLDSAASALKPSSVIRAMSEFASTSYANVHRGSYEISREATRAYEEAHERVARFIGAFSWREVIFTKNTTESIQLVATTLLFNKVIEEGDEIVTSEAEHHSNLLPWVRVAERARAKIRLIPVNEEGVPRWDLLGEMISRRTKVVAIGHASNVTGYVADVRSVAKLAHEVGALVVVDGAQSVPHMRVNVKDLGADFLAFSGHKIMGPTGIGVLWGREDLLESLEPPLGGGGTVSRVSAEGDSVKISWSPSPAKFEAGTPPIIEAVGLSAAIEYLERIGMDRVEEHERELTRYAISRLSEVEGFRHIGTRDLSRKLGIVAFNVGSIDPGLVGAWLDAKGIAVRAGFHCAHVLHERLGERAGSVRASFYIYNCRDDIDALASALAEMRKI